jgi:hypothetical protein
MENNSKHKNYILFTYTIAGCISVINLFGYIPIYTRVGYLVNILGINFKLDRFIK